MELTFTNYMVYDRTRLRATPGAAIPGPLSVHLIHTVQFPDPFRSQC